MFVKKQQPRVFAAYNKTAHGAIPLSTTLQTLAQSHSLQLCITAGGGLGVHVALTLGFANLVADGIAMALGDFLSSKAEFDFQVMEQNREFWEYDVNIDGEKEEMVELLESKGLEKDDATRFIDLVSTNRQFFVEFMVSTCDLITSGHNGASICLASGALCDDH
jgi:hypothetical protein